MVLGYFHGRILEFFRLRKITGFCNNGLILVVLIAGSIRLFHLGRPSLWSDELFTAFWSREHISFIMGPGARLETIPPEYYVCMHLWVHVFGASALSLRIPSVIFSTATVCLIYFLAKNLFDKTTAFYASSFAAINPFFVQYAQDARPYAMLCFFSALALLSVSKFLKNAKGSIPSAVHLGIFVLSLALTSCFHYTAIIFIVSCLFLLGLYYIFSNHGALKPYLVWSTLSLAVLVLISRNIHAALNLSNSIDIAWIPPLTIGYVKNIVETFIVPSESLNSGHLRLFLVLLMFGVIASASGRLKLDRLSITLLLACPFLYFFLLAAVSLHHNIMITRPMIWMLVPFCILAGRAVRTTNRKQLKLFLFCVVLAVWGVSTIRFLENPNREDWRAAANIVSTNTACRGPVLFGQSAGLGLFYYQPLLAQRDIYSIPSEYIFSHFTKGQTRQSSADYIEMKIIKSSPLPVSDLPQFLQSHPNSALVLKSELNALTLDLTPKWRRKLSGGLIVECF